MRTIHSHLHEIPHQTRLSETQTSGGKRRAPIECVTDCYCTLQSTVLQIQA